MKKKVLKELEWAAGILAFLLTVASLILAKFKMKEIGFWLFVLGICTFVIAIFLFITKAKKSLN